MSPSTCSGTSTAPRVLWFFVTGASVVALSASAYYLWKRRAEIDCKRRKFLGFENLFGRDPIVTSGSISESIVGTPTPAEDTSQSQLFDVDSVSEGEKFKKKGNALFAEKRYEEAILAYSHSIAAYPEAHPDRALSYANRAACYLNKQKYDDVIADCDASLAIRPLYIKSVDRRGRAYEGKGQLRDALQDYTLCAMLGSFKDEKLMRKTDTVLRTMCEEIASVYFKGKERKLASPGTCREFLQTFSPIMAIDSLQKDISDDHFFDGVSAMHSGDFAVALSHFKASAELEDPSMPFFLSNYYGSLLFLSGKYDAALEQFEIALRHSSDAKNEEDAEVLIKKAFLLFERSNIEEAIKTLSEASNRGSNNPYVCFHRAEIFLLMGEVNAAMENYDQCIKLRGDFLPAYLHKSKAFLALQQPDASRQLMRKVATKLFPTDADAMNGFGETFVFTQDYESAKAWFLKALAADSNHLSALLNMAIVLITQHVNGPTVSMSPVDGQIRQYLDQALLVDPHSETAHLQMANYLLIHGDMNGAEKHFDSAFQLAKSFQECVNVVATKESSLLQSKLFKLFPELEARLPQMLASSQ